MCRKGKEREKVDILSDSRLGSGLRIGRKGRWMHVSTMQWSGIAYPSSDACMNELKVGDGG